AAHRGGSVADLRVRGLRDRADADSLARRRHSLRLRRPGGRRVPGSQLGLAVGGRGHNAAHREEDRSAMTRTISPRDFLQTVSGVTRADMRRSGQRSFRLATVDEDYDPESGDNPKVTFDGELNLSGKRYP